MLCISADVYQLDKGIHWHNASEGATIRCEQFIVKYDFPSLLTA